MHRFPRKLVGLALLLVACGSPGDLDDTKFPAPGQTGYADDPARLGGAGTGGTGGRGTGGSGTGGRGTGGSGAGGTVNNGGTGGAAGNGQGGSGEPSGACPDDISELFNRPGLEGGCEGGGCHVPGGQTPDLTSPGVDARLLNVMSTCKGRPYISAADSFLEDKLVNAQPDCGGYPMPFGTPTALSAADEQCIVEWIDEVAAGL